MTVSYHSSHAMVMPSMDMINSLSLSFALTFFADITDQDRAKAVTGRFGGDLFRRQFFAESSIKFWTFRQKNLPVQRNMMDVLAKEYNK